MAEIKMVVAQSISTTKAWRWIALLLALSQLAAPPVIDGVFENLLSTGTMNEALITPAGWAFSIWGLITPLTALTCAAAVRSGLGAPSETRALVGASVALRGTPGYVAAALWALIAASIGAAHRGSTLLSGASAVSVVVVAGGCDLLPRSPPSRLRRAVEPSPDARFGEGCTHDRHE